MTKPLIQRITRTTEGMKLYQREHNQRNRSQEMSNKIPRLVTVGVIAKELDEPIHRVEYILRTRKHIAPRATAGGLRLFDNDAIEQVLNEIISINTKTKP